MVHSLIEDARESGWLPKWVYAHFDTNEMIGDPAANVIADAYLKGLVHPADVQSAYAAVLHNATDVPNRSPFEGRTGLEAYVNRGFVPYYGGRGDYTFSASVGLEYAVNDCAIALMAGRLGQAADANYFLRRAKRYRGSIDTRLKFARARRGDGSWKEHFHAGSRSGFKEGSSWQYTWLAPQDVAGLAAALGGTRSTLAKLDEFFAYGAVVASPASAVRRYWHASGSHYNPHNEVDLQAPYLYDYLGQPWKTADMVRAAETLYTTAPNGLPGGDDLGTMSGWYVLSALGLYPVMGGDDHYALTTPMFDHVEIDQPGARPLVIDAPSASTGLRYIEGASLNGHALGTSSVSHGSLVPGGHLSLALGNSAGGAWATGAGTPSAPCSGNPATADVRIGLRTVRPPRRRARVEVIVRNAGDVPASGVNVQVQLPGGWSASNGHIAISALGAGRITRRVWTLRARPGSTGAVRAEVQWSGGRALRSFATTSVRIRR
jgi:predicted alpha-1,2-mannosidase